MIAIETVGDSKGCARTRGFKSAKIVRQDRPVASGSSLEVLNQSPLPGFEFTGQNICLNGIKKFPSHKSSL